MSVLDREESPEPEPVMEAAPFDPLALGNTGEEMYRNTEPIAYADADTGYAWRRFIAALSELLDPIAAITRPTDGTQRWANLGSPRRCPSIWLPVLAQWAGVRRPDAMSEQDLRDLIGPTAPGMWRGTRAGLLATARRFLPEGASLYWEEFADGDPYHFRVFTFNTEPEVEAQIREALLHAKPAGLFPFTYEVRVGQTWAMLRDCGPTWWQVNQAYANWFEVMHQEPEVCRDVPDMPVPPRAWEIASVEPDDIADMASGGPTVFTFTGELVETEGLSMQMTRPGNTWPGQSLVVDSETQWRVSWFRPNTGFGDYVLRLIHEGATVAEITVPWTET